MTPPSDLIGIFLAVLAFALPVSIAGMNAMLLLLLIAVLLSRQGSLEQARNTAVYAIGVYCAVSALTSLTGLDAPQSLQNLPKDLHKFCALGLLLIAFNLAPSPRAYLPLGAGFALISLTGIIQAAASVSTTEPLQRAHAFVHPMTFGLLLGLGFLGGLCFIGRKEAGLDPQVKKRWGIAFLILCGLGLLLNHTRGAFLGIAAGYAALCLFDRQLRRWAPGSIATAIIVLLLWELLPINGRPSIHWLLQHAQLRQPNGTINPDMARFLLWRVALQAFWAHPWFGVGPGHYHTVFPQYFQGRIDGESAWGSAHNLYLHQMAERGIIGLAALGFALGALLYGTYANVRKNPNPWTLWAWATLVAFLVMNLTEVAFQNEQVTTLVLFAWAWGHANRHLSQISPGTPLSD